MNKAKLKVVLSPEQRMQDEIERLRDTLWKARTFASQVALHAFTPSKAADLQTEGNTLIDLIDDAMYGDH